MSRVFLFGYGSLLNKRGRDDTYPHDGAEFPVLVHDLARGWYVEDTEFRKHTTVCVFEEQGSSVNGALLEIHEESLPDYDARETGYYRAELDRDQFEYLSDERLQKEDRVFVYEPNELVIDRQDYPITQSYIDIVMKGFMDISDDFALQFLKTTRGWEKQIINDRENLWWPRSYNENDSAEAIDQLLCAFNPAIVENRLKGAAFEAP